MPAPYTESVTGVVHLVWHGDNHHAHQIIMREGFSTKRYYSWNLWAASFCEEASKSRRPISFDFSRTGYGLLMHTPDWAAPSEDTEAAS